MKKIGYMLIGIMLLNVISGFLIPGSEGSGTGFKKPVTGQQDGLENWIYATSVLHIGGDAMVTSITAHIRSNGWTGNMSCALYVYDTNKSITDKIASTEVREFTTAITGYHWLTFNFTSPVAITNNTNYYLCAWAESDGTGAWLNLMAEVNHANGSLYKWDNTHPNWDANIVGETSTNRKYNLYMSYESDTHPYTEGVNPTHGETSVRVVPHLNFTIVDNQSTDTINVTLWSNSSGSWEQFASFTDQANNTNIHYNNTNLTKQSTIYYWSINLTDGTNWNNETFVFTTQTMLKQLWKFDTRTVSGDTKGIRSSSNALIKDIDGDGINEIFWTGLIETDPPDYDVSDKYTLISLNSSDGSLNWQSNISGLGTLGGHRDMSLGDLNNDGTYEIVTAYNQRTIARNAEDGSIFWNISAPGSWHLNCIADTDQNNYPYVYTTTHAGVGEYAYKINGSTGTIVAQYDVFYSCYGGISVVDLDCNGEFEILISDDAGLICLDEDMNLLWQDIDSSNECFTPVSVNITGDEKLEIVNGNHSNPTYDKNGSIRIIDYQGNLLSDSGQVFHLHEQPLVADVDNDSKWELIDGMLYNNNLTVWDLETNTLNGYIEIDNTTHPPTFGNICDENGDTSEVIVADGWDGWTNCFNETLELMPTSQYLFTVSAPVVYDVDGDGYNEFIGKQGTNITYFDTVGKAPDYPVRCDHFYYTERRFNQPMDIPIIGPAAVLSNPVPADEYDQVSKSITQINITITDPQGDDFDWTIETSPDIGSASGSDETDGTKICSVSGADSGINYTWWVNVTDNTNWVRQQYNFITNFTEELKDIYIYPNANGYENENAIYGDSPAYKCVDEVAFDGDSTFIYSSHVQYVEDYFNLDNVSVYGTINNITIEIVARDELGSVAGRIRDQFRTYNTNYINTTTIVVTTNYGTYSFVYETNPYTGNAWTWTEIDDLQAGVGLYGKTGANQIRCSRIRVKVNYTTYPNFDTFDPQGVEENNATFTANCSEDGGLSSVRSYFQWGQSTSYGNATSSEFIEEGNLTRVNITGLLPGTTYHYRIVWIDQVQRYFYGDDVSFTTKPEGPTNLTAELRSSGTEVYLEWINGDGRGRTVILRNTDHDPTGPSDGIVVYNGTGFFYTDTPIEYGISQYYRAWSWSNPFSDNSTNASIIIAPAPPFNGSSTFTEGLTTVNFTWERGNGSMREIVLEKQGSYSSDPTDGVIHQNSTDLYYNLTVNTSSGYFSIWSYNVTQNLFSGTGLQIPWGVVGLSCFNESNPAQAINFNLEISNQAGDTVYQANDLSNTHFIDANDIPTGERVHFVVSNSSYRMRDRSETINFNGFYNFSFYLPLVTFPSQGGTPGENYTYIYRVKVINEYSQAIPDAKIKVKKYINTTDQYEVIGSGFSDGYGEWDLWLMPSTTYKVFITKSLYQSVIGEDWITDPIFYGADYPKIFQMTSNVTTTDNVFTNLTYNIDPENFDHTSAITFYFNITADLSDLMYAVMRVHYYNSTNETWELLNQEIVINAVSASMNYTTANVTGKYGLQCIFKRNNFDPVVFGAPHDTFDDILIYYIREYQTADINLNEIGENIVGRSPVYVEATAVAYASLAALFVTMILLFAFSPKFSGFCVMAMGVVMAAFKDPLGIIGDAAINYAAVAILIILGIFMVIILKKGD